MNEFLRTHRAMMMRVALAILRNQEDAEDAVQDASLNIFKHWNEHDPKQRRWWVQSIIRNSALSILRKKRGCILGNTFSLEEVTFEEPTVPSHEAQVIAKLLLVYGTRKLSPPRVEALKLWADHSIPQNCSTIKTRALRARRIVIAALQ